MGVVRQIDPTSGDDNISTRLSLRTTDFGNFAPQIYSNCDSNIKVVAMNKEEILAKLQTVFRQVLADDSIVLTEETTAKDVAGWDSLSHVMLVVDIETAFKKRFKAREIQNWQCVGDMVTSIQNG
jgi:acyl carrier protein